MIFAEEESPTEFTYGTVASISDNQISLSEYDYEKDEDVTASYFVSEKTEFNNVKNLQEILAGDVIDIIYQESDGKRLATHISVEKPENEFELDEVDAEGLQAETEEEAANLEPATP